MRRSDSGAEATEEDPAAAGRAQIRRRGAEAAMDGISGRGGGRKRRAFGVLGGFAVGSSSLQLGVGRGVRKTKRVLLHSSQPSVSMKPDTSTVECVEVWPLGIASVWCPYGAVDLNLKRSFAFEFHEISRVTCEA